MTIRDAIDTKRVHHQLYPEYADLERGFSETMGTNLKKIGHKLQCIDFVFASVQGISVIDKKIQAASDDRWSGRADGL